MLPLIMYYTASRYNRTKCTQTVSLSESNRPWARKGHRAPPLGFYGIGILDS